MALKYKGETRGALKEFEAASDLLPKWADAHYGLGTIWYDLQDQTAALKELRTAAALDPANAAVHRLLGRILSQQNNLVEAEHELKLALRLKASAETHLELGVVEGQLGKLNVAVAQFREAIRVDPALASAHHMLGVALRPQGDHKGALDEFRKSVTLNPNDAEAQYDLGRESRTGGDKAGAIAAFRRAIELKPDLEQAHYNLGLALRDQGDPSNAKKELDELSGLHEFRTRQQKLDEGMAMFQKSAEIAPELPTSYYYLGVTWEGKNDPGRAREA